MAFRTDAQLLNDLKDILQKVLPSYWTSIATAANSWAYWQIVGNFSRKGYTKAQIDLWDSGAEIQRTLGIFQALNHGAAVAPDAYSAKGLTVFDIREWLSKEAILTISGEFAHPAGTAGQVLVIPEDTSSDGLVPRDPDDGRLGEPMNW